MESAINVAIILLSILLMILVVVQARSAGMSNRDTSSMNLTRRGLDKALFQSTIVISALFLVLSLIASLPLPMFAPAPF